MNPAKVLVVAVLAGSLSIGAAMFGERWFAEHEIDLVGGGAPARVGNLPALRLPDLDGREVFSHSWAGKVVVLNFWATWCPPCLREMPMLDELQRGVDPASLTVVGIAIDAEDEVREFLEANAVGYEVLLGDADAVALSKDLGNRTQGLPFTVVFDSAGRQVYTRTGELTAAQIRENILPLVDVESG
jgi:thiol-disulfide isomerase/thioredoxin